MLRGLVILSLVIFLGHLGYMFASPVIKNQMLEAKMVDIAKNRANKSDQELRADLMKFIKDKGIPLSDDELFLERHDEVVYIAAHYTTDVTFYSYSRHYEFFPVSGDKTVLYWKQSKNRTQNAAL